MSAFRRAKVTHSKRKGNTVAQVLAKKANFVGDFQVWIEEVPLDVLPFVIRDLL